MSKTMVAGFWNAMGSNDFQFASTWLHPDFEYYMPQSREYLCGRDDFVALNESYPAEGAWSFVVRALVSDEETTVSDVEITDGTMKARAITFHTLKDGLIWRQKEYWPDEYAAPLWRRRWVQLVDVAPF